MQACADGPRDELTAMGVAVWPDDLSRIACAPATSASQYRGKGIESGSCHATVAAHGKTAH